MPISSISRFANMGLQYLHRASVPVGVQALRAMGKAHPGVNPEKLLVTCDQLFGERRNYTIIGSTSLHLQSLRFLKPEQT